MKTGPRKGKDRKKFGNKAELVTKKTASKERLCTKRCSQIKCKKTKAFDPEKVQIRKKVKFKDKCINDLTIFKERGKIT